MKGRKYTVGSSFPDYPSPNHNKNHAVKTYQNTIETSKFEDFEQKVNPRNKNPVVTSYTNDHVKKVEVFRKKFKADGRPQLLQSPKNTDRTQLSKFTKEIPPPQERRKIMSITSYNQNVYNMAANPNVVKTARKNHRNHSTNIKQSLVTNNNSMERVAKGVIA